ncbi:hypothetical protein [Paraburkholderia rhizosphaerae]|uniref:hypothetical protein n=1 Tax=Paraburkholderia rhizosphaerae TaxID=480658 RepID=UPI001065EC5C|nr:hypothetical protein [Paraburkholderia rhizosphaerae]
MNQSQVFTAVRDTDSGLDGVPAEVSFAAGSTTGKLSINSADYATLTPDAANDGNMTVGGTPTLGVTLGVIPPQQPVLFPGIIQACEPDATGAPNPAAGNTPLKSKVVAIAGLPIKNVALLLGTSFPTYYENCLRDGLPTPQTQHSKLTVDGNAILSITDVRNSPNPVVIPPPASLLETQEAGNAGDWLIPFLYITADGTRHIAVVQHGTVAGGHDHNFVGVWLDQ